MKKFMMMLMLAGMSLSVMLTGCGSKDEEKVQNAQDGQVVELEGESDQYGWFPHMRLTFSGDTLTEVYFDYVDDAGAKKSDDDEYNSSMKEKTGVSGKEAMEALRQNLIAVQNPMAVDIVTGATQTSEEFIAMADQGFKQYFNDEVSANNYGNGDPTTTTDDKGTVGEANKEKQAGTGTTGENAPTYDNGGDGSPNNPENSGNAESTGTGGGAAASGGTGAGQ